MFWLWRLSCDTVRQWLKRIFHMFCCPCFDVGMLPSEYASHQGYPTVL